MFGVVPKTLWSKHEPSDELNRIEAGFNCFVVETDAHRILIETGGGVRHDERARERMRLPDPPRLTEVLAQPRLRSGVDRRGRSTRICIGTIAAAIRWTTGAHVLPALPRARYVTQRGELEHAREQHPRDAVSYRAVNYEPLIESGHMHLLDGDGEVAPGVEVRVTPGHNRDMMVVLVRSGGETWCHFADLVAFAAQLTPTWVSGVRSFPARNDRQQDAAARMRRRRGLVVQLRTRSRA